VARKETLKQFIDKLPKFSSSLDKLNQARFNAQAIQTLDDAKERAPLASGTLVDSGSVKRVSIKGGTLEVQWIFNVPYAKALDDPKSGLNLKAVGKISSYIGGQKIRKKKKGDFRVSHKNG